jgi:predicted nucleic acid-binding protein
MIVVGIAPNITAVQADPDDNAVIATAIAGQAEVICTRDRHFHRQDVIDFCSQHGIRILDDIELLNELRASGTQGSARSQP